MTLLRCGTVADNASVPGYMLELFASKHHFGNVRNYATVSGVLMHQFLAIFIKILTGNLKLWNGI